MARFRFKPKGLEKLSKAGGLPSDAELADRLGVHRTTVYRVLKGEIPPGIPFLAGMVQAYGWDWCPDFFEIIDSDEPPVQCNGHR